MTPSAGNALLKVLEEPPARTTIILTAQQASDLLPTIVSRCQHLRFDPVPLADLSRYLVQAHGVEERIGPVVAALAGGSYSRALEISHPDWIRRRRWLLTQMSALADMPAPLPLALAEKVAREKNHLEDMLLIIESWLRDLMVFKYSPQRIINTDMQEIMAAVADRIRPSALEAQVEILQELRGNLRFNPNMRLALEVLFTGLAKTMSVG
jgi:DNA polymerase-3 subunit delta'